MSRYGQNGIVRCIKTVEKVFHFLQCSLSDVCDFLPDGRPAVRMRFVCQFTQQMRRIPVGLVQVALLEFLNHHLALHLQTLRAEIQTEHAVAFQPESRFHVLVRQGDVIICNVVVGPGIVLSSGILHGSVVVGDVEGTSEHQVLERRTTS